MKRQILASALVFSVLSNTGFSASVNCPVYAEGSIYNNSTTTPTYAKDTTQLTFGLDDGVTNNRRWRAYVWWDLSVIPSGVAIENATVTCGYAASRYISAFQKQVLGGNIATTDYAAWNAKTLANQFADLTAGGGNWFFEIAPWNANNTSSYQFRSSGKLGWLLGYSKFGLSFKLNDESDTAIQEDTALFTAIRSANISVTYSAAPSVPNPSNGQTITTGTDVTFQWNEVRASNTSLRYRVQYCYQSDFAANVVENTTTVPYWHYGTQTVAKRVYWRVRVEDSSSSYPSNYSSWGGPWYFDFYVPTCRILPGSNGTGSGSLAYSSGTACGQFRCFDCGTSVQVTANPSAGSYFERWYVDNADAGTQNPIPITANNQNYTSVTAKFTACSYSISPTSRSHGAGSASSSVSVTANSACSWTATSNGGWITVTGGSSGNGNGSVNYSVSANTGCSSRTGTMTIAGKTYTVTQDGLSCSFNLSASTANHPAGSGSGSVGVTASASCCDWTASSNAGWLTITAVSSDSGNGTVSYSVASNTGNCITRTGTLTIAGQTFTVTQLAGTGSYSISPTSRTHGAGAESSTVSVTAGAGCNWTASSNTGWISITSGASGTSNGTVGYSVQANPTCSGRSGTMTIVGQIFTVTQAAGTGIFTLSPTNRSHGAGSESGTVSVTASSSDCGWTATSNVGWLSITAGSSGTGNGTVSYNVAANTGNCSSRSGTLTIAGQTFTVNQAADVGGFSIAPTSRSHGSNMVTGSVTVTASSSNCSWTASSNAGWITITVGSSGTGNGTVNYSVSANTGICSSRTGTLTIAGKTFTVNQAADSGSFTITPTVAPPVPPTGGSVCFTVSASSPSCSWTASSGCAWVAIASGSSGTGNGTVCFSVPSNASNCVTRSCTVTIAGQTFTVTQAAGSGSYAVNPTGRPFGTDAATGTILVSAGNGCTWTASSNDGWITITSGGSGNGNGTVSYSVADNNSSTLSRTGTVSVAGETFTVTQAGVVCVYSLSVTATNLAYRSGLGSFAVISQSICGWTVVSNDDWITITSGSSGTGNGTVSYSVGENTTGAHRSSLIAVADKVYTVNQDYNHPPQITAPPTVTNAVMQIGSMAVVVAGETNVFTVGAVDPDGDTMTYRWEFGGNAATSTYVYAAAVCSNYLAGVTVSSGTSSSSAPLTVMVACQLDATNDIASLQVKLNYAKANADGCALKAMIDSGVCAGLVGKSVTVDVGGAQVSFTLDTKGRGVNGNGTCRFAYSSKAGACVVSLKLKGGDWRNSWAKHGLTNETILKPGKPVTLPVVVVVGDEAFMGEKSLHYTATQGKSGSAK